MNTILVEKKISTGQALQIAKGDITTDEVDAIVNAANDHLQHCLRNTLSTLLARFGVTVMKTTNWQTRSLAH